MKLRALLIILLSLMLVLGSHVAQGSTVPLPDRSMARASIAEGAHALVQPDVDAAIAPDFGTLPLSFAPNAGQSNPAVRFQARSRGGTLFFTPNEVVLSLPAPARTPDTSGRLIAPARTPDPNGRGRPGHSRDVPTTPPAPPAVARLRFEGANPAPEVSGIGQLPGTVNYFIGNDATKWRTNLPTYAGIVYRELYPGVDLRYDGTEGMLKGTYVVSPGADPTRIRWRYDGATSVHVDEATGDLLIRLSTVLTRSGEGRILTERAPVAWQSIDGRRVSISVHYTLTDGGRIAFALGAYDPNHPLMLDPTLRYSTYLGGSGDDFGYDIAVDSAGNAYVTGRTRSTDFPTARGLDNDLDGPEDAFVTKLNVTGDALLYSTYIGGGGVDEGTEIAVDSSGNAYIAGTTTSTDFPTASPLDNTLGGGRDGFVAKLNAAGNALHYSTYLGGSGEDYGKGIAVDTWDNAYVTGYTCSSDFPTASPLHGYSGGCDAFVVKLNLYGSGLFYSTYLGGSGNDQGFGIAADSAGNAYVTGSTLSTNFPADWIIGSPGGSPYAFVTKLSPYGSARVYSIYLGGTGENRGDSIAVDSAGNAYVAGTTRATNFPTKSPFQATYGGQTDAFVAKLDSPGEHLLYGTYLGGSSTETQIGIAVDSENNVYVTGTTNSANFPTANALDGTLNGQYDVFVAKLEAAGTSLRYSTYLGGNGIDESKGGAVVYHSSTIYVAGTTTSTDFPAISALDSTLGGAVDAFVAKIVEGTPPTATIDSIGPSPATQGLDTIQFRGSGQDTDESGAYITAYSWASDIDGPLGTREGLSIPASELSAGTHTITFRVQDDEFEWSPEVTGTLTVLLPSPGAVRTLILVNRQKLVDLYSASEADQVMNKVNALASHPNVAGSVVQVENNANVATAYAAWDADPTNTAKANAVTAAVRDVVVAQWSTLPNLTYLIIVGDDRVIPFRRVQDQTGYPESNYTLVSSTSTIGAALHDGMTLTDDYYADAAPTVPDSSGWDGHALYIPDLGIGRLIETPNEITGQIDTFLQNSGVTTGSAIVTGYDFVKDGAQAMCSELNGDGITTDCALISEAWSRAGFIANVLNIRHDIISINGHANHYIIGTPSGSVSSSDVAGTTADHRRAIFYTVGCHSGLNVPPTNPYQPLDTAQALIQHQANYIANTGYGWGSRTAVAWSEQLMLDFTERLAYGQSATVGQALAAAKQEYYLNERVFEYYDEKILIESTLYGLPMYRYTTPTAAGAQLQNQNQGDNGVRKEEQITALGNGLTVNSISYQFPPLITESTDNGTYYTFGGLVHSGDGEPIQPKYTADFSFPGTRAHGAVFKSGVYTNEISFNPVVDRAITETAALAEPAFSAPGWYPSLLHHLNRLERGDKLVTLLGQFNPQNQVEWVYDRLGFDIYYHTSSSDWTPPSITSMGSRVLAGSVLINVGVEDDSGIEVVVIAYTDGNGTWHSVDLTEGEGRWSGNFPASAGTVFFVQAVDKAGNVAVSDNNGQYFQPGENLFAVYLPLVLRMR